MEGCGVGTATERGPALVSLSVSQQMGTMIEARRLGRAGARLRAWAWVINRVLKRKREIWQKRTTNLEPSFSSCTISAIGLVIHDMLNDVVRLVVEQCVALALSRFAMGRPMENIRGCPDSLMRKARGKFTVLIKARASMWGVIRPWERAV